MRPAHQPNHHRSPAYSPNHPPAPAQGSGDDLPPGNAATSFVRSWTTYKGTTPPNPTPTNPLNHPRRGIPRGRPLPPLFPRRACPREDGGGNPPSPSTSP